MYMEDKEKQLQVTIKKDLIFDMQGRVIGTVINHTDSMLMTEEDVKAYNIFSKELHDN